MPMGKKRPTGQSQQHADYRKSDAYKEEQANRASAAYGIEQYHTAADATNVAQARNETSDSMRFGGRDVLLTNNPAGVFDIQSSALPQGPARLMSARKTLAEQPGEYKTIDDIPVHRKQYYDELRQADSMMKARNK